MRFLQFSYNTRPSSRTCASLLLFFICSDIQFCKAYWWQWPWSSSTPNDIGTTPFPIVTSTIPPSEQYSTPEECARQCQDGEPSKTCYYRFQVEYYTTNNLACNYCEPPLNDSRINSTCECIISDGFEKTVFSINRMIPGPSIQVCLGDCVIIDVVNEAEGLAIAIHWHGIFQKGYQYYDGVPHVTQCPIIFGDTFRYHFCVNNSGTHFYHSHVAAQIIDGQYGSLIVRDTPKNNPYYNLYDEDLPEHVCVISDLFHEITLERYPGLYRRSPGQDPKNFLINGRGNYTDPLTGVSTNVTYSIFIVESGKRYRFRVIDSCGTVCPITLSIQNHPIQIIATDGEDINPISANAINMASGERYDFVLSANQTQGQYWIYVRGLGECEDTGIYQLAVLVYQGSSESSLSPTPKYSDLPRDIDRTFNPINSTNCGNDLCVDQTCKVDMSDKDKALLNATANTTLKLSFDFFEYSSSKQRLRNLFNTNSPEYEKFFVAIDTSHILSEVGKFSYADPPTSLSSQNNSYEFMCGNRSAPSTCTEPCSCTHVYHLSVCRIVDVMIYDKNPLPKLNHPFHLHGYSFCVMLSGQFNNATNKSEITKEDVNNVIEAYKIRVQNNDFKCCAPKDTVIVPNTGYVILRFRTDNPGWWFFHCHFSWHTWAGMNIVFHVGEPKDMPPVPPDFPKCYNWMPSK